MSDLFSAAAEQHTAIEAYEAVRATIGIDTVAVFVAARSTAAPIGLGTIVPASEVAACPER